MNDEYLLPLLMNLCNCQKCRVGIPCKSVNATKDALDDHYAAQHSVQADGATPCDNCGTIGAHDCSEPDNHPAIPPRR